MVHFSTVGGSAPAIASAGSQIGSRGNNVADAARSLALHEKRKLRITGASCSLKMLLQYVLLRKAPLLQSYDVPEIVRRYRRSIRRQVETRRVFRFIPRVEIERDAAACRLGIAALRAVSRLCPLSSVGSGVANSRTLQAASTSIQPMQQFKKVGRFNSTTQISANYPQIVSLDPGA
jgi:hypothetical protein